jgi:hypothetical protein
MEWCITGADQFSIHFKYNRLIFQIEFQHDPVPFPVEARTVDLKTDIGKCFTIDNSESMRFLVVYQINIMVLIADDTQDVPEICFMIGQIVYIKSKIEVFCKTDGIVRGDVQRGSFFKHILMTAERQTIRTAMKKTMYLIGSGKNY